MVENAHRSFLDALTDLLNQVQAAGMLRNGSVEYSRKLIATSAVEMLLVYQGDTELGRLFRPPQPVERDQLSRSSLVPWMEMNPVDSSTSA